jgi:uncharacterized protein (DUF58 family)
VSRPAWLERRWQRWLTRRIPAQSTVRLDHRRLFIMPSRTGVAFGAALLLMLLAAINYQNSLAYGLTFLLASVYVVAILHTWRNLAGLQLQATSAVAVFCGDAAHLGVRLLAGGRSRWAVALGWPPDALQQLDVPADEQLQAELALPTARRGWLRAPRLRVESRFPLGILVVWSWIDLDQQVLVYPRPLPGELPMPGAGADDDQELSGERPHSRGVDDYQGLRVYQPGDSRRRLHWKAYSRGQGLLVKDFSELTGSQLELDLERLAGDLETRLSILCHWVLALHQREQPYALRLGDQLLPADTGDAHRDACLRALALHGLGA